MTTTPETKFTFTLDTSRWLRGDTELLSLLLDHAGRQCCIGQLAEQCGVSREFLLDRVTVEDLHDVTLPPVLQWLVEREPDTPEDPHDRYIFGRCSKLHDSDIANEVYGINDSNDTTDEEKITRLRDIFAQHGIELAVTDGKLLYPEEAVETVVKNEEWTNAKQAIEGMSSSKMLYIVDECEETRGLFEAIPGGDPNGGLLQNALRKLQRIREARAHAKETGEQQPDTTWDPTSIPRTYGSLYGGNEIRLRTMQQELIDAFKQEGIDAFFPFIVIDEMSEIDPRVFDQLYLGAPTQPITSTPEHDMTTDFKNETEAEFWRKVFLRILDDVGANVKSATQIADAALQQYRQRAIPSRPYVTKGE